MRIALGTISKQKKKFLEEALKELKIAAVVEQCPVLGDVADQPIYDEEVKQSSINRAVKCMDEDKKADMGVGVECGYQLNADGGYEMFCWATVIDKKRKQISARSSKLLPIVSIKQITKESEKFGDFIRQILNKKEKAPPMESAMEERKPIVQLAIKEVLKSYWPK